MNDRAAFPALLRQGKKIAPTISHVWLDNGYTGPTVAAAAQRAGIDAEIVAGPKPAGSLRVQPHR